MLKKNSYIFIAGHKGLVGSSLFSLLKKKGYKNIITLDKKKVDLRNERKLENFFKKKKIDVMIMAAAKVGGIIANKENKAQFYLDNTTIQNNLLKLALNKKVKRTVFLGTSCIYPKNSKTPIKEEYLLTGKLETTNETYALAKIGGIKLSEALYFQQNLDVVCLMPTNLYGLNDNYDPFSSHVIPGIISKIYNAKIQKRNFVKLLGTGKPIREFLHANDLAAAIYLICKLSKARIKNNVKKQFPMFNVGSGESFTIKKLANIIKKELNYSGNIIFDNTSPDGTNKKNLESSKIKKFGWKPKIKFKNGIKNIIFKKYRFNDN